MINIFEEMEDISYDYSDSSKTKEEKIFLEKRRRYQTYMMLEYILANTNYFNFFSFDAFRLSIKAKCFAQLCKKEIVMSEFLFFSFFYLDSSFSELLKTYKVDKHKTGKIITIASQINSPSILKKQISFFKNVLNKINHSFFSDEFTFKPTISYSQELNRLLEKSTENAVVRFKTPIVSSEILFLTLIEEKGMRIGKLTKEVIITEDDWYLLRYKVLKRLYLKELSIRTEVSENQKYFAYLLNTQITDVEFTTLINKNSLMKNVSIFRNKLIEKILQKKIFDSLEKDTHEAINLAPKRVYSFYK
jgi:hypothetical protein